MNSVSDIEREYQAVVGFVEIDWKSIPTKKMIFVMSYSTKPIPSASVSTKQLRYAL